MVCRTINTPVDGVHVRLGVALRHEWRGDGHTVLALLHHAVDALGPPRSTAKRMVVVWGPVCSGSRSPELIDVHAAHIPQIDKLRYRAADLLLPVGCRWIGWVEGGV